MITYTTGDILRSDADALVNTVNCVGVMGRGIALQFKNAFPANFKAYAAACEREEVRPGAMFIHETGLLTGPQFIINFPTKRHWRGKSRMEDIETGLEALRREIQDRSIQSVAIPPLGAGLGGLFWPDVKGRIEAALADMDDLDVIVFEPSGAPDAKVMARTTTPPKMTPGRAALVTLMNRYLRGSLDPFVTLLEVHKLMYFLQEAGQPLRLNYKKHVYGPYAENLRQVLKTVEGHMVSGYADGGDQPDKPLEIVPGAVEDAHAFLRDDEGIQDRLDRVGQLVDGFETPFGLELLATVHWVTKQEGARNTDEAIAAVHSWNARKKHFSERQISMAYEELTAQAWI